MRESRRSAIVVAVCAAAIVGIAAGCGSSSSSNDNTSANAGGGANAGGYGSSGGGGNGGGSGGAAVISTAKNSDLGKTILVDSKGNTVYLFEKDDEPDESYCNGACAGFWPPVTTSGKPVAKGAVDASKLATLKRDDGKTQVSYAGHPLYTYVKDTKPGQANGNGVDKFGAEWYALEPNGAKAEEGGNSGGGGGGGGGASY